MADREAQEATAEDEVAANEFGNRSQPWFQSHIMISFNDPLRTHYGTAGTLMIQVITEAKCKRPVPAALPVNAVSLRRSDGWGGFERAGASSSREACATSDGLAVR
jgi:hypothetical protein